MARYTGATQKIKRRFGLVPDAPVVELGRGQKPRQRKSIYSLRLTEKQKLKFIYGILEKQFRRYFTKAQSQRQNTAVVLLQTLETRLDNLVYRLGYSPTRNGARQLVSHGHVLVEGKKVDIPSYNVKVGQTITLRPKSLTNALVITTLKEKQPQDVPNWLERKGPVGKLKVLPEKDQLRDDIDINLIVEYYSR